jgi:hypothetical protein
MLSPTEIESFAKASPEILALTGGASIKKIIIVPDRLINIIV